jgi:exosortase
VAPLGRSAFFPSGWQIATVFSVNESILMPQRPAVGEDLPVRSPLLWKMLALFCLALLLYSGVLARLAMQWWTDPNFSHGFFVPLISVWIVWERRKQLRDVAIEPSNLGLLIILWALFQLVGGVVGAEIFLARTSFVELLGGLIVFLMGWKWLKAVAFPWLFLLTGIPLPAIVFNEIAFPLQLFASKVATALLRACDVPLLTEGNIITLANVQLEVAEACSGIRSLVTLVTLALVYGYFMEKNLTRRTILALSAIPIAIAANAFRIFGTGICAEYWDPRAAQGFFHEFSGWVVFVLSLFLLLGTHALIKLIARVGRKAA